MLRVSAAGFLANVLGLLTFILVAYLCLAAFTLFYSTPDQLARARAEGTVLWTGPSWPLIGETVVASTVNLLEGVWAARVGFLIFGVLGVLTAWAHQAGQALDRERAWLISIICLGVILSTSAITWRVVQREETDLWLATVPEMHAWRPLLAGTAFTSVASGLIFSLVALYPMWALWRWWYVRLTTRLAAGPRTERDAAQDLRAAPAGGSPDARRLSTGWLARRQDLLKVLLALFVLCVALLIPVERYHDGVAMRFQYGRLWLGEGTETFQQSEMIRIEPDAYDVRVVNINGVGVVSLYLSPTDEIRNAFASVEDWSFEWRSDEYLYQDIPTAGLGPGNYFLHFVQESGWGFFEYTLAHGGGTASHISAALYGFLLACCVVLGLGLIALGAMKVREMVSP